MSEWISVKDRFPEYNVPVLVTYIGLIEHNQIQGVAFLNEGWNADYWCWWEGNLDALVQQIASPEITHWMPLPDFPEVVK